MHIFDTEAVRQTHQGNIHAWLESIHSTVRPGTVCNWRKEFVIHDADGNPIGKKRDYVFTVTNGERRPVKLTITAVDKLDLEAAKDTDDFLCPTIEMARACGHTTVTSLRNSWLSKHPRSPLVQLVWFVVGDVRDRPLFLGWTGRAGGDYVRTPSRAMDQAEALTPEQLAQLANWAQQRDIARRARISQDLANETLAQRVKRLESARERLGDEAYRAIRQNLRVISQRVERAEKRAN